MNIIKYTIQNSIVVKVVAFLTLNFVLAYHCNAQCDPAEIDLCEIGKNSIIQACYHAQIIKTSNGYSITGEDLTPDGNSDQSVLTNIPSANYPMPAEVVPIWGAIGGRTQAVFLGSDNKIYAVGEEDLLIDNSFTSSSAWGVTSLKLPVGITVCDVNKWEGTAGSGSDNNDITSGQRDGFLVFSTVTGELYITGDGARNIQSQAINTLWTQINMPDGITVVDFAVGYRTLLIRGSDEKLYASGPVTYLGDGTRENLTTITPLTTQPNISVFGITQIEAGWNSYLVLDGDGTVHVLGYNLEGGLGVGNSNNVLNWSKVGIACSEGVLRFVAYISTLSTHDNRTNSSAILVDGTVRSWGSNSKQAITSGVDRIIDCPVTPVGTNRNAIAISNGGHISPYVNTNIQICNIGHNKDGAFGDGVNGNEDYGEYICNFIPGNPEICGTKEVDLKLDKTVSDTNPHTGDDITYAITVTNDGPYPSTGSFVRDQLKDGLYYLSDDSNGTYNNNTGLWIVGPLDVGESKTLNITVKVILSGYLSNYAQIFADNQIDPDSTPGDYSSNQDDDDIVQINAIPCPVGSVDILLCPDDSLFVANNWIYNAGIYIETIPTAADCDSLHITNVQYVESPPEPELQVNCEDLEYMLSIDPFSTWQPSWDNGDTNYQTRYDSTVQRANLTMETAPNCVEEFTVPLPTFTNIHDVPMMHDTIIVENHLLAMDAGLNNDEWQIQWSPSSIVNCDTCMIVNIIADESTLVTMHLEHISGCKDELSFFLTVEKEPEHIYAPNIFSPNGDLHNDEWTFYTSPNLITEECKIFDRWGNIVYHSKEDNPKWDGISNGKDCLPGVYVYSISLRNSDGMNKVVSGDLTLIR